MKLHGNGTIVFCVQSLLWDFQELFENDVNSALYKVGTKAIDPGDKFLISSQSEKCLSHGKKPLVTWIIFLPYIYKNIPTYLIY